MGRRYSINEEPEAVKKVIDGSSSATEFLYQYCDGKLTSEDFNEEGNAVAEKYYGDKGYYLDGYMKHFGELMYVAPESAHDFEKFSNVLESRYSGGVLMKPWWKFW